MHYQLSSSPKSLEIVHSKHQTLHDQLVYEVTGQNPLQYFYSTTSTSKCLLIILITIAHGAVQGQGNAVVSKNRHNRLAG